jgi:hypothetical protein
MNALADWRGLYTRNWLPASEAFPQAYNNPFPRLFPTFSILLICLSFKQRPAPAGAQIATVIIPTTRPRFAEGVAAFHSDIPVNLTMVFNFFYSFNVLVLQLLMDWVY